MADAREMAGMRPVAGWGAWARAGGRVGLVMAGLAGAGAGPVLAGCLDTATEAVAARAGAGLTTLELADGRALRIAGVAEPWPGLDRMAAAGGAKDTGADRMAAAADSTVAGQAELARWLAAPGLAAAIGPAPDRHGRWPARLSDGDGRDLATRLVEAGLVPARPSADAPGCAAWLYPAEAAARAARRGIWADAAFWPLAARAEGDADSRRGAYVLIEARIHSIRRGDGVTFVNFGADFRRDFTALFPHKGRNRGAFVEPPHSRDIGREVRVRGVVGGANALSVRIESPEQWEWSGP